MAQLLWLTHRSPYSHSRAGGAERTLAHLAAGLAGLGHSVTVISVGDGLKTKRFRVDGVDYFDLPTLIHAHLTVFAKPIMKRFDFVIDDLAHVVPWYSPLFRYNSGVAYFRHLHARTLKGQVKVPLAFALSGVERTYPLVYRHWRVVTESAQSVRDLESLGFSTDRISRIPPGVDSKTFRLIEKSPTPRMVYYSGFREYKRPQDAILVLQRLRKRGVPADLTMVGRGVELEACRQLVRKTSLTPSVRFLERLSDCDLAQLIGQSWVHIHCSRAEGWGNTVMEAAACGVPTVAYKVPGVSETVQDGITGYLAEDGDIESLTSLALLALKHSKEMEVQCRKWAESHSWDLAIAKWNELISSTV